MAKKHKKVEQKISNIEDNENSRNAVTEPNVKNRKNQLESSEDVLNNLQNDKENCAQSELPTTSKTYHFKCLKKQCLQLSDNLKTIANQSKRHHKLRKKHIKEIKELQAKYANLENSYSTLQASYNNLLTAHTALKTKNSIIESKIATHQTLVIQNLNQVSQGLISETETEDESELFANSLGEKRPSNEAHLTKRSTQPPTVSNSDAREMTSSSHNNKSSQIQGTFSSIKESELELSDIIFEAIVPIKPKTPLATIVISDSSSESSSD